MDRAPIRHDQRSHDREGIDDVIATTSSEEYLGARK